MGSANFGTIIVLLILAPLGLLSTKLLSDARLPAWLCRNKRLFE